MRDVSSGLGGLINVVADVIRDQGHVMFCVRCRRAEMPGTVRCSKCGGSVGHVIKLGKKSTSAEAA